MKYGKQELSTRVDIPFYTKAGYQQYPAETLKKNPNKQYLGYGYYHNLRYSFHYRDQIYAGITAERMQENLSLPDKIKKVMIFIHYTC